MIVIQLNLGAAASVLRTIAITEGAIVMGAALMNAVLYYKRWRAGIGRRQVFVMMQRIGTVMGSFFIVLEVAQRFPRDHVTYRTPLALIIFTTILIAVFGIFRDDERRDRERRESGQPMRRATDYD